MITFDDLPFASIARFQAHITMVAQCLQAGFDDLHRRYPTRVAKGRIDAGEVCRVAPQLFRLGQVYVGSLGHGIDCPQAHPEIIAGTFRLLEDLCLSGKGHIGLQGGVGSGKSSILALFRLLIGPFGALSGMKYIPQLIHNKYRSTVATSHDLHAAFMELYGGIQLIREDGRALPLNWLTHSMLDWFGKASVAPVTSTDIMQEMQAEFRYAGYEAIALCDDVHRLASCDMIEDKLRLGPSVERITSSFGKAVLMTMRPEYLPLSCEVHPLVRSHEYASTQPWHRGVKIADSSPQIMALSHVVDICDKIAPLLDADDSLYLRLMNTRDAEQVQGFLAHHGIATISCDAKIERSEVSDRCWDAYRHGRRFALLSYGPTPLFHRALPQSVQTFVDLSRESSSGALVSGLCGSASGYNRGRSRVFLSAENAAKVADHVAGHRRYGHTGTLRLRQSSGLHERFRYLADQSYALDQFEDIDDLIREVNQQGRLSVEMYEPTE